MLDVQTMNGSLLMASTAGTESTAKTRSVVSRANSTMKSGVAINLPPCRTKNFCPSYFGLKGRKRRASRITGFWSGCVSSSLRSASLMPVMTRKPPKT